MVWPGLIFLFIFAYIPIYGITIAFKDFSIIGGFGNSKWVGFKYFIEFLTDPNLPNVLRNTISMNLLNLLIGFPAPVIFAVLLSELKNVKFKKLTQTVSYLPHFLSWVIFGGLMIDLLSTDGVLNVVLRTLGIMDKPVNYIGKGNYFYFIYVFIALLKNIGFSSILYIAAIAGISQEMYEAANIDGANRFQKAWYITIPCILGTVCIMLIFQISDMLNTGIEQLLVLQNSLNIGFSETLDTYVYKTGINQMRFSYSTAVGFLKSMISVLLLIGANSASKRLTEKGLF